MHPVSRPFDVVVTTNSGYPLDLNLYQSVKGMSAAAQVVPSGGAIICVAECSDGVPDHGEYKQLLASRGSPRALLDMINTPGFSHHDQWQVQLQAQIQIRAPRLPQVGISRRRPGAGGTPGARGRPPGGGRRVHPQLWGAGAGVRPARGASDHPLHKVMAYDL